MKTLAHVVFAAAAALYAAFANADAPTFPSVGYSANRMLVFLQTYTDSEQRYSCNYTVVAMHDNGATESLSSLTEPPTGGQPTTAATIVYGSPVRTATVTTWQCSSVSKVLSLKNRTTARPIVGIPCQGNACRFITWSGDNIALYVTNVGTTPIRVHWNQTDVIVAPRETKGSVGLAIEGTPTAIFVTRSAVSE
jgi:hypothetical protein